MKFLRVALPVIAMALLVASCAKLPQADVDAANAAFADAKTALADQYAPDSFKAASGANDALQANLKAKDYGKTAALSKALVDASAKAKTDAVAGLGVAKAEIAQLADDIGALAAVVQKDVAKAVPAKAAKAKLDVKPIKASLATVKKAVADAQASTDFLAARNSLAALKAGLAAFQASLESAGFKG